MTNTDFKKLLKARGYAFAMSAGRIIVTHRGGVDLRSCTALPEGVQFNNQGCVNLEMPLADVLRLAHGPFGDAFRRLFA